MGQEQNSTPDFKFASYTEPELVRCGDEFLKSCKIAWHKTDRRYGRNMCLTGSLILPLQMCESIRDWYVLPVSGSGTPRASGLSISCTPRIRPAIIIPTGPLR